MTTIPPAPTRAKTMGPWAAFIDWWRQDHDEAVPTVSDALRGYTKDELERAALRIVHRRLPWVSPAYLGGTLAEVERATAELARLREEYASLEPVKMRRAIMGWLDWKAGEIAERRQDIEQQTSTKQLNERRGEREKNEEKTQEILALLKLKPDQS